MSLGKALRLNQKKQNSGVTSRIAREVGELANALRLQHNQMIFSAFIAEELCNSNRLNLNSEISTASEATATVIFLGLKSVSTVSSE